MVTIKVDPEKCAGCGSCVDVCPVGVYVMKEQSKKIADPVNADQCLVCRACEAQCPNSAIQVTE